MMSEERPKYLF